jgi:Tol biopolymer transport system component
VVGLNPARRGVLAEQTRRTVTDSVVVSMKQPYQLIGLASENEFHTWTPDGTLLTAAGSRLLRWSGELNERSTWIPVADLGGFGVRNISRLAFSPDGRWIAFVAEPAAR